MKENVFNFSYKSWQLKVHSKIVNLHNLGLSEHFDTWVNDLKEIVYLLKQIKLRTGIEYVDKHVIPFINVE